MKAQAISEHLLLQKIKGHKSKQHSKTLELRLQKWEDGKLLELLDEAQGIQDLLSERQRTNPSEVSRIYEKLILEGNVSQATNFLDQQATKGGILKMTEEIKTKLETLHPEPAPTDPAYLAKGHRQ